MQKIQKFLEDYPVFYYATIQENQPEIRPFGFKMWYQGALHIGMGTHKPCYRQTVENPNVALCALGENGTWLRINATAVLVEDPQAHTNVYLINEGMKDIYNEETGYTLGLFRLENCHAQFTYADKTTEEIAF